MALFIDNDDRFNWNYGLSLAAAGDYLKAEKILMKISDEKYTRNNAYISWLAVCFIGNGKPKDPIIPRNSPRAEL